MNVKRDVYWDVVKGLGIGAVVLGHSGAPWGIVINYWHLAIFFFVSGYLYSEKYDVNPVGYIMRKYKDIWWPTIKYVILYILLHNVFLVLHFYGTQDVPPMIAGKVFYSGYDILRKVTEAVLTANYAEEMAGAMWFVFPMFMAMVAFGFVRSVAHRYAKDIRIKELFIFTLTVIIGSLGFYMGAHKLFFALRVELGLLILPVVYLGYMIKMHLFKLDYLTWWLTGI